MACVVKNSRYAAQGVGTRYGLRKTFVTGANFSINGKSLLKYLASADVKLPLVFDANGGFWYENPQGSGVKTAIADPFGLLKAGMQAQIETAYNKAWLALSDLIEGRAKPCVFDGNTKLLDPVSEKPVGIPWSAATLYRAGHVISPTVANGHLYRSNGGTSGAVEPVWPLTVGGTIADNGMVWTEVTPMMAQSLPQPGAPTLLRVAGLGAFPVNRDVYIKTTWVNGIGETVGSSAAGVIVNTVLNDRVAVTEPVKPAWLAGLIAPYAVVSFNVYEADVATGGGAPADAAYRLVGTVATGGTGNVDATAVGAVMPVASTAAVVPAGNICAGDRYMVVLFENRNGYISGMSSAVPVKLTVTAAGFGLYSAQIPTGPANTAKRICAFTIALDSTLDGSAGPFHYIPENDTFKAVAQTTTVIADNVTTKATFNFIDDYLVGATDVTEYFKKIEVPECTDIFYSKLLDAMVYSGVKGYPTGIFISDEADPETVNLPGSLINIGQNDGQRVICTREVEQAVVTFKDGGAHQLQPNNGPPSQWGVVEQWKGSGPCGPRALDIVTGFLAYADPKGLYVKQRSGLPEIMSKELKTTWSKINWAAKQCVWVKINEEAQEILVGVPLGAGQLVPNKVLRLNYRFGWEDPVVFSVRMGKLIPNVNGRKWSVDDIAANLCTIELRDLTASVDLRIDHKQLIFSSSANDGLVRMEVPDYYSDEDKTGAKVAIDWQYETVDTPSDNLNIMQLGGASVGLKGNGTINLTAIRDDGTVVPFTYDQRKLITAGGAEVNFDAGVKAEQFERWKIKFDNGNVVDAWAELHKFVLHMRPMYGSRAK